MFCAQVTAIVVLRALSIGNLVALCPLQAWAHYADPLSSNMFVDGVAEIEEDSLVIVDDLGAKVTRAKRVIHFVL